MAPLVTLSLGRMTADRALLSVFIVVCDNLHSCKLTKKSSTIFRGGWYELMPHLGQSHATS